MMNEQRHSDVVAPDNTRETIGDELPVFTEEGVKKILAAMRAYHINDSESPYRNTTQEERERRYDNSILRPHETYREILETVLTKTSAVERFKGIRNGFVSPKGVFYQVKGSHSFTAQLIHYIETGKVTRESLSSLRIITLGYAILVDHEPGPGMQNNINTFDKPQWRSSEFTEDQKVIKALWYKANYPKDLDELKIN